MKTKEELNTLKEEVETVNKKLAELTDEELAQVSGGGWENAIVKVYNGLVEGDFRDPHDKVPDITIIAP